MALFDIFVNLLSVQLSGLSGGSVIKNPPANEGGTGDAASIPGLGRSSAGGMATHSSILAWGIPWTEEPGGLQSMGPQRVGITEGLSTHTHLAHQLDLSIRLYSQSIVICCFDLYLWRRHLTSHTQ